MTEHASEPTGEIVLADNMEVLPGLDDGSFRLIYIDPPFNSGKKQARRTLETVAAKDGARPI